MIPSRARVIAVAALWPFLMANGAAPLIPHPQSLIAGEASFTLPKELQLRLESAELVALLDPLRRDYKKLTGNHLVDFKTALGSWCSVGIDRSLGEEQYILSSDVHSVTITAGSYGAAAMGTVTFLQLLAQDGKGTWGIPCGSISDMPDAGFRGIMIDVARNWHDVATLEGLIDLARWYKLNYVQLHLSDNERFTFPSQAFPELPTPGQHYSEQELRGLVEFARVRGVTLVPEIDLPAHAKAIIDARPDLFGFGKKLKDRRGRERDHVNTLNLGRDQAYSALDALVGEVAAIFTTSPYVHLGGDEADLEPLATDSDVQRYLKERNLDGMGELYRHFLVRMNESVIRHGKRLMIWEGFSKNGKTEIPRNITVVAWETAYQLPQDLLASGYRIINATWKPLYVVTKRGENGAWDPQYIYSTWNPWRWANPVARMPSFTPIQLEPTPQVVGAMMCSWENPQDIEISVLRRRIAAFSERAWNGGIEPERPMSWFEGALEKTDAKLSVILHGPAAVTAPAAAATSRRGP